MHYKNRPPVREAKIEETVIADAKVSVPSIRISPSKPVGAAVVVHGYGGSKEELLGLSWHVAQKGLVVDCIDLRGHGEHPLRFDESVLDDVEVAIQNARKFGKVVSIGHSLGGRLSLISGADFAIGISPPLDGTNGERTEEMLRKLRGHRVRTDDPRAVFELLKQIPTWNGEDSSKHMIIYGSRDIQEIVQACDRLRPSMPNALRIAGAMHADTFMLPATFEAVARQLTEWYRVPL
ncbi:MAG TPA: alpha/beta fold hydrolase [Methanomassiliicoccales archaeon]|nr:alpha/beta fold hydrolase [Methanomassiliicoccales archaeon]